MLWVTINSVLAWIVILILALALAGLVRRVAEFEGLLRTGSEPHSRPNGYDFSSVSRRLELSSGAKVILFAKSGCISCREVVPRFIAESRAGDLPSFVLYADEAIPGNVDSYIGYREHSQFAFDEIGVRLTPSLMVVNEDEAVVGLTPIGSSEMLKERMRSIPELGGKESTVHGHFGRDRER